VTTLPPGEHVAVGPQFLHGMRNAAATYASSVSTDMAAYEDLLGHHLLSIRNLIPPTTSLITAWPARPHPQRHMATRNGIFPAYWTR
jgi:hypothetical protein